MPLECDILNTGSELVLGRTLNRHGAWLGEHFFQMGLSVRRALTLPDGDIIRDELKESMLRAEVVVVTGGLGPTSDDMTREYVAGLLGLEMFEDEVTMERIRERLAARGRVCGYGQRQQAMVPEGALVLANERGTAPGLAFVHPPLAGGKCRLLFLLPGPPNELHPMFLEQVLPMIRAHFSDELIPLEMAAYHFAGIGEGDLADKVDPVLSKIAGLEIGYCAHAAGTMELRLIGTSEVLKVAKAAVEPLLGQELFSRKQAAIEVAIVELLRGRGETVAMAESCTGGALASRLTDVAGSSAVVGFGFVTYANEAKTKVLGVPDEMIAQYGAVSEEVAKAMADGALIAGNAEHAISLTGIAGPDGGSDEKPVGTVWIGLAGNGMPTVAIRHRFMCDRATFKLFAVTLALNHLRLRLCSIS